MHAINDSDKVGNLYDGDIKTYLHNKINNDFFFDIYCSRKQKLYKHYKGPNSINEWFEVVHYIAKVP